MRELLEILREPWPWYITGPLIGLTVPLLLWLGNKPFGISRSFKHICAATTPFKIKYFKYNWKEHLWNLFFVGGVLIGAFIAAKYLGGADNVNISQETVEDLRALGVWSFSGLLPQDVFNWANLVTSRGLILMVVGGFLVGFGTRYAGGCTSGHSIMGLSSMQMPSLIATISFFVGGIISTYFLLPLIF